MCVFVRVCVCIISLTYCILYANCAYTVVCVCVCKCEHTLRKEIFTYAHVRTLTHASTHERIFSGPKDGANVRVRNNSESVSEIKRQRRRRRRRKGIRVAVIIIIKFPSRFIIRLVCAPTPERRRLYDDGRTTRAAAIRRRRDINIIMFNNT